MILLLPPSEGKASGGSGSFKCDSGAFSALSSARMQIVDALKTSDPSSLGLTGERLELAREANKALAGSPCLPAYERYTGVVMTYLDYKSLPTQAKKRARQQVVFISALGGAWGFTDLAPEYRLKMSARLSGVGNLAAFWKPKITPVLPAGLVIDLLPREHEKSLTPSAQRLRVELVSLSGMAAGHAGKAAKGLLARELLSCSDPEDMLRTADWNALIGYDLRVTGQT